MGSDRGCSASATRFALALPNALLLSGLVLAAACASSGEPQAPARKEPGEIVATGAALSGSRDPGSFNADDMAAPDRKTREMVIAPIPIVNPTIGNGLALGVGVVFPPKPSDPHSEPTILGGGGFYTDSGSWGAAALFKTSLRADRIRAQGAALVGDVHYDFFGIGEDAGDAGISVPLVQKGWGVTGEVLYAVYRNIFAGVSLAYADTKSSLEEDGDTIDVPASELDATLASAGIRTQWDERDNSFYPKKGHVANLKGQFFDEAVGSDFTYQKYTAYYNHYFSATERDVVAVRGYGCFAPGRVPFFDLCLFGTQSDLRGYDGGKYRDKAMFAAQIEWRRELPKRFGVVLFTGAGEVLRSFGDASFDSLLPSTGVGIRWNAAPQNHINLRIDYAVGKDSEAFYVSVGEAF